MKSPFLAGLAVSLPLFAFAQAPSAPSEDPRTFTISDFEQFAPRNALDMVERIPGFSIRQADEESSVQQWFNDRFASYRYDQIAERAGISLAELNQSWWPDVWAGHITADGLSPLLDAHPV